MIKQILIFLSAISLILFYTITPEQAKIGLIICACSIIVSCISVFPHYTKEGFRFSIILFLYLGIIFFNSKWFLYYFIDPSDFIEVLLMKGVNQTIFVRSTLLLSLSLPLISLSYLYYLQKRHQNHYNKSQPIKLLPLIILAWIVTALCVRETPMAWGALYIGSSNTWFPYMIRLVQLVAIVYAYNMYIGCRTSTVETSGTYSLVIFYSVYLLIGGERGNALSVMLIMSLVFLIKKNFTLSKKSIIIVLGILFLLIFVFNFVENARLEGSQRSFVEYIQSTERKSDLQSSELCTCLAVDGIDNEIYDHSFGVYSLISSVNSIPFLGDKILMLLGVPPILRSNTAGLITYQYAGPYATSGLGTTYLADSYIEFGIIGVILVSLLLGWFVVKIDDVLQNKKKCGFTVFLLYSFFVAYSIYFGRASIVSFLCNFIHAYVIFVVYNFFIKLKIR